MALQTKEYLTRATINDPDKGKYVIELYVDAKTVAEAKRKAHKAARDMGACYITKIECERR